MIVRVVSIILPLLTSAAAVAQPHALTLEIGLVRVSPFRPGTQTPWDSPTPQAGSKDDPVCHAITGLVGLAAKGTGPIGLVSGSLVDRVLCAPAKQETTRDPTAPDIYVSIVGADDVTYRTYVVPHSHAHLFQSRFVVPAATIPASGLRVIVQDSDQNSDEVIGQVLVPRDQLLRAASNGELLVLKDDTGALERLDLTVGPPPAPGHVRYALNTATGSAPIPNLRIAAGQAVVIRAFGQYTVRGRFFSGPRVVNVNGEAGTQAAGWRIQTDPFRTAPHGATIALLGRARAVQPIVVGECAIIVNPYDGALVVGVNDRQPHENAGQLEFDVETLTPRPDLWARPGQRFSCPPAAPQR